jgi:CheY-like chemotaxis protein
MDVKGHRLDVSIPDLPIIVHADPVRVAQVISNVLTNAAKYTDRNGQIWLSARQQGQQAEIVVRDTGIGIAPHLLPQVFDLFVQADHSASKSQGGLGIGLTLVKNLLELHGGNISVQSAGLGQGAEFTIQLPLAAEPPIQSPAALPTNLRSSLSSGLRLLVVDDNEDAARSLATLLQFQGHDVKVACNGAAALGLAPIFSPDMALLDLGMPEMDGYEVARRLRLIPSLENIFLVALTGWGQHEDRRRTAEAGFDEHLIKPPEPLILEELLTKLKRRNVGSQV